MTAIWPRTMNGMSHDFASAFILLLLVLDPFGTCRSSFCYAGVWRLGAALSRPYAKPVLPLRLAGLHAGGNSFCA